MNATYRRASLEYILIVSKVEEKKITIKYKPLENHCDYSSATILRSSHAVRIRYVTLQCCDDALSLDFTLMTFCSFTSLVVALDDGTVVLRIHLLISGYSPVRSDGI